MSSHPATATSTVAARRPRIVVMISGSGTNLQALIDAAHMPNGPLAFADLSLVVSNRTGAYGLTRAAQANIPTLVFPLKPFRDRGQSRAEYDVALAQAILDHPSLQGNMPDLVVLAGWMHILSPEWLAKFPGGKMVVNLHPALPGEFDGAHAIERAYEASKGDNGILRTGCMVHYVIPEVDKGEVILTREVPIRKEDSLDDLEKRMHETEHKVIVAGVRKCLLDKGFAP
ncbi:formyl transferase [Catenaria anguillulae PL171]|uniref:phosphoribosylglycinamide formyltransferase 1 n=1 Tax=Catenaria anguillulae PL171 TaxID=765915 RepID=A0A1Y2HUG7_9FUNG|nr:formyl transferase [Catenaria anguillulae PL171]